MSANQSPADVLAPLGFRLYNTGGGCTAFRVAYTDRSEILVTEAGDPSAPESMESPVYVGLYNYDEDGESMHDGILFSFSSLWAALPMLSARIDAERVVED